MNIPTSGWSNQEGTAHRACRCGSWKEHWVKFAKRPWPKSCSVEGCSRAPTLGAHVFHPMVGGEKIVPMCDRCSDLVGPFTLKPGISLPSAIPAHTCG